MRVIDITSVGLTVTEHSALTFPDRAVMIDDPAATAVTLPSKTVATPVLEEVQLTVLSVAFSGEIVAANSIDSPAERVTDVLLSFTDDTVMEGESGIGSLFPLVQAPIRTNKKMAIKYKLSFQVVNSISIVELSVVTLLFIKLLIYLP